MSDDELRQEIAQLRREAQQDARFLANICSFLTIAVVVLFLVK